LIVFAGGSAFQVTKINNGLLWSLSFVLGFAVLLLYVLMHYILNEPIERFLKYCNYSQIQTLTISWNSGTTQ